MRTAAEVIVALELLREVRTPACDLRPGDAVVYQDGEGGGYVHAIVHAIEPASGNPADNWLTISTSLGHRWSCSPHNARCHKVDPSF